ncbi:MAG: hypothetical protein ACR5LA_11155 [Wolbachia sp.]
MSFQNSSLVIPVPSPVIQVLDTGISFYFVISSYKSAQFGFSLSTKSIFHSLFQLFKSFSLFRAEPTS